MHQSLYTIGAVLFDDTSSLDEVKSALREYKNLLQKTSVVDVGEQANQEHVQLENGIAIGLKWAASCLDDAIRTQKFVRGTKRAIELKLKEKACVHVLYAGTGPYATLILPLLDHFSSDQLKVTLLDLNPESINNLKQIIESFNFQEHVHEIRCADATKTRFENASTFDILLTETMQHALQDELQIVISSRLLNQMRKDALIIPQSIELDLVRLNSLGNHHFMHLMKVDADFIRKHHPMGIDWSFGDTVELSETACSEQELLAIATKIEVYKGETIDWNESGLTAPKIIYPMIDVTNKSSIYWKYVLQPAPGFEVTFQ